MDIENETVTISRKKYKDLLRDQKVLYALEAGGVDNWEFYGEALADIGDDDDDDMYEGSGDQFYNR